MAKMNKNTWLIILLVVLNLFSLGALWLTKSPPPTEGPIQRGDHKARIDGFFKKELNLDEDQMVELRKLTSEHMEKRRENGKLLREQKRKLLKTLSAETEDSLAIESILTEISRLEANNEKIFVEHFRNLKTVCTPEQQENLHRVFDRGMRNMRNGPPDHPQRKR
jgi:protein CpxP